MTNLSLPPVHTVFCSNFRSDVAIEGHGLVLLYFMAFGQHYSFTSTCLCTCHSRSPILVCCCYQAWSSPYTVVMLSSTPHFGQTLAGEINDPQVPSFNPTGNPLHIAVSFQSSWSITTLAFSHCDSPISVRFCEPPRCLSDIIIIIISIRPMNGKACYQFFFT